MQQLKNKEVFPTPEVLTQALGESYRAFHELMTTLAAPGYGMETEWRYYNDGKAWLCKITRKKKTVCWLSVWDHFFKISCYFTLKHREGILDLNIPEEIKQDFRTREPVGKLIPLIMEIREPGQIPDLLKVLEYKVRL
ncbi:MAG TPA: DUF3788 family protein [Bacteroidales bacterium]|nr:DUF3788 family protein [Bacteroidales bacterium]HPS74599.1 DUF3788 family protein [Bacteroidales bacterium]